MSSDSLYSELGLQFKPEERRIFLEEFADVVSSYKSPLGDRLESEASDIHTKSLLTELQEETVHFAPQLPIDCLTAKFFADLYLNPPLDLEKLLEKWNFYLIKFPVHLYPKGEGWSFNQLECIVEFKSDQPSSKFPVVYQIFPDTIWEEVLNVSFGLKIVLDESLKFRLAPSQATDKILRELAPAVKAEVGLATGGKAILGPFDHRILKSKVYTSGCGDVKVRWNLKGEKQILQQDPSLSLVLQVPKAVSQVNAKGAMAAYRTFDFWNTPLPNVMQFLSDRTRNFMELGAPAIAEKSWDDITV
jgi:hypothetical protein